MSSVGGTSGTGKKWTCISVLEKRVTRWRRQAERRRQGPPWTSYVDRAKGAAQWVCDGLSQLLPMRKLGSEGFVAICWELISPEWKYGQAKQFDSKFTISWAFKCVTFTRQGNVVLYDDRSFSNDILMLHHLGWLHNSTHKHVCWYTEIKLKSSIEN